MEITKKTLKEINQRVEKLKQLEEELNEFSGFAISITRLTILKYLCRDSLAMCEFAYEIAKKTKPKIVYKEEGKKMKKIVNETINLMEKIIRVSKKNNQLMFGEGEDEQINTLSREFWKHQDEIRRVSWTNVRQITNWKIYLIEKSLDCFKYREDPKRGYELGRSYAERYKPEHGTGLITESQESVKEIRAFWEKYYKKLIKRIEVK